MPNISATGLIPQIRCQIHLWLQSVALLYEGTQPEQDVDCLHSRCKSCGYDLYVECSSPLTILVCCTDVLEQCLQIVGSYFCPSGCDLFTSFLSNFSYLLFLSISCHQSITHISHLQPFINLFNCFMALLCHHSIDFFILL